MAGHDFVQRLSELAALRSSGAITEDEFQRVKTQMLGDPSASAGPPSAGAQEAEPLRSQRPETHPVNPSAGSPPPSAWRARPGYLAAAAGAGLALLGMLPFIAFAVWLLMLLGMGALGGAVFALSWPRLATPLGRRLTAPLAITGLVSAVIWLAAVPSYGNTAGYVIALLGMLALAGGAVYEAVHAPSAVVPAAPWSARPDGNGWPAPPGTSPAGTNPYDGGQAAFAPPFGDGPPIEPSRPAYAGQSASVRSPRPVSLGCIVAAGGGALVLLSFFVLPTVSVGFLGSLTGAQLTSLSSQLSSSEQSTGWTAIFWLVPVVAAVAIGLSAWIAYAESASMKAKTNAAISLGAAGVVAGVLVLVLLIAVTNQGFGFVLSSGAYLTLLGLVIVAVGGFIEHRQTKGRLQTASHG